MESDEWGPFRAGVTLMDIVLETEVRQCCLSGL